MDLMISSSLSNSTLLHSSKTSDYVLRQGENTKFSKDLRNAEPLQLSVTQCFIPLVMNKCDRRGAHFQATLLEFASLLIKRSSECRLLQRSFTDPPAVALSKILNSWGSRLTWAVQKERSAQVIRGVETHKVATSFIHSAAECGSSVPGRAGGQSGWQSNCRTGWTMAGWADERASGGILQGPEV
jgi:hypothetical protein